MGVFTLVFYVLQLVMLSRIVKALKGIGSGVVAGPVPRPVGVPDSPDVARGVEGGE